MPMSGTDHLHWPRDWSPTPRQQSTVRMEAAYVIELAAASHWAACPCLPSADWLGLSEGFLMSAPWVTIVKHFPVHAGEVESLDFRGQLTSSGAYFALSSEACPRHLVCKQWSHLRVHLSRRDPLGSWLKSTSFISESWSNTLSAVTSH